MPKPWEKYQGEKGPWDRYKKPLEEARQKGFIRPFDPTAPAGTPEVGVERNVGTLEGDVIDVKTTGRAKVISGYTDGRPMYGEQFIKGPKSAGLATASLAALTHDPEAKKRVFARARFGKVDALALEDPTASPHEVISVSDEDMGRYRALQSGEIVFRGDDGLYYHELPPGSGLKKFAASTISDAPVIAGESVGVAMGGVPGMAAGAGVGELVKRGLARLVLGEKQTALDDYVLRPLTAYGVSAASGIIGKVVGPMVDAGNALSRRATGAGQVGRIVGNEEIIDRAGTRLRASQFERFGIEGDTARVTQSDVLGPVHHDLAGTATPAGRILKAGEERTRGQIKGALVEGRGGLPKMQVNPQESGEKLVKAARDIRIGIVKGRRSQADRLYKKAFQEAGDKEINIQMLTDDLKARIKDATGEREKVLTEMYNDFYGKPVKVGDRRIGKLDDIQKRWRQKAGKFKGSKEGRDDMIAGEISEMREKLIELISDTAPAYRVATQAYRLRSQALEKFEGEFKQSLLAKLTKVEKDYVHKAPGMLFGPSSSPELISRTKSSILSEAGGWQKWDAIKRGALTGVIKDIDEKLVIDDLTMRKLKAAVTPKEYEAFQVFRKVLGDIGYVPWAKRGPKGGEGFRLLEEKVGGAAYKLRRLTLSPYIQSKEWTKARVSGRAEQIAKELSTGSGIKKILKLRQLSPESKEYAKIVSGLLLSDVGRFAVGRVRGD